jgi:uridine kinase
MARFKYVVKRSGAIVPFNQKRISNTIYRSAVAVGGRDRDRAEWLADEVVKHLEATIPASQTPHIEEIQDAVEKILIENGHAAVAKAFILYRDERRRKREASANRAAHPSSNIPWAKIWRVLNWAVEHSLHTIPAMNERIDRGEFPQIVHESESAYEDDVETAARLILERRDELRVVLITGPSSSGKTSTTFKLEQRLKKVGLSFATLNVDNYFFDLELHPKDEFGDYDFETPQALDLELINQHLQDLIAGEEILVPYYDFKTGTQQPDRTPMHLEENQILLIDSLHGLYPKMTGNIPDTSKFKLYLEPLLQMKGNEGYILWTDLRLIRRMLRDASHRAYQPEMTLAHWHYVRTSEMRNIIPYIGTADFIINSAMPYELCFYKARLFDDFASWVQKFRDDPLREDAFMRADRIHKVLQQVIPVDDESSVPKESVLREFIGGSSLFE